MISSLDLYNTQKNTSTWDSLDRSFFPKRAEETWTKREPASTWGRQKSGRASCHKLQAQDLWKLQFLVVQVQASKKNENMRKLMLQCFERVLSSMKDLEWMRYSFERVLNILHKMVGHSFDKMYFLTAIEFFNRCNSTSKESYLQWKPFNGSSIILKYQCVLNQV